MMAATRRRGRFAVCGSVLGVLLFGVAACTQTAPQSRPCPVVKVVPDASYVTSFSGESEDLTDTAFEAQIGGVKPLCKYIENTDTQKVSISSDLLVKLTASRGPKVTGDQAVFNYFVALTGQGGALIKREKFDVTIPLTADKPLGSIVDNPVVTIPLKKGETGDYYQIYVYLDVTEKQLAYNRRNPRQ